MQKFGTNPELDKLVDSEDWRIRIKAAEQGYGLDKLINDEDYSIREAVSWQRYGLDVLINDKSAKVRAAVAIQGYGLDKLINDEEWYVRAEVAKQGYGLDVLIKDEEWYVRAEVARQGYGLDKLVNDEDWHVRKAVARQGYGLDVLINDESWDVRYAVAEQGYGLDKLINDEDWDVREAVKQYLKIHNYKSIDDWVKQNPDKVYREIEFQLNNDIKDFIYKIDDSSKLEIQSNCDNIDDFFIKAEPDILVIQTVDTKEPIIKVEKSISDQKASYKFIVDITNEDGEIFIIKTFIKSREQLDKILQQTVEYLSQCPAFSKYIDDLENCL